MSDRFIATWVTSLAKKNNLIDEKPTVHHKDFVFQPVSISLGPNVTIVNLQQTPVVIQFDNQPLRYEKSQDETNPKKVRQSLLFLFY